jgi:hypothetical protein
MRDGWVDTIELAADPPFGVVPGVVHRVQPVILLPGDRLVFVTDGVLGTTSPHCVSTGTAEENGTGESTPARTSTARPHVEPIHDPCRAGRVGSDPR